MIFTFLTVFYLDTSLQKYSFKFPAVAVMLPKIFSYDLLAWAITEVLAQQ